MPLVDTKQIVEFRQEAKMNILKFTIVSLSQGGRGSLTKAILFGQFETAHWLLDKKPDLAFTETDNVSALSLLEFQ